MTCVVLPLCFRRLQSGHWEGWCSDPHVDVTATRQRDRSLEVVRDKVIEATQKEVDAKVAFGTMNGMTVYLEMPLDVDVPFPDDETIFMCVAAFGV